MKKLLLILIFLPLISFSQKTDSVVVFKIFGSEDSFLVGYMTSKDGDVFYPMILNDSSLGGNTLWSAKKIAKNDEAIYMEIRLLQNAINALQAEVAELRQNPIQNEETPDTLFIRGKGIEIIKE